ncbi:pescadillo homolog [Petromyzon marinus]|uniref:pescadillo homolog n=1 Tax=Petromyzon marinus TaxID=7757 RepID=UPI003F730CE0
MGGQPKKKYTSGEATSYITRNKARKKLQLSLPDFRRLCILKGVYPHEPRHKKKANKGSTAPRTFYLAKDVRFLLHEPIVAKFREYRVFVRKLRKAYAKTQWGRVDHLKSNKPTYKLDHIIKERYPTFVDALRDVDDGLSMCCLFSSFPRSGRCHVDSVQLCRRLSLEFHGYVVQARALRKVFLSIKGIYFQAEVQGQTVTWVMPYPYSHNHPTDVDYRVMSTFTEFYTSLLGFINYRLYQSLNLAYPPRVEGSAEETAGGVYAMDSEAHLERLAALSQSLARIPGSSSNSEEVAEEERPDEFLVEEEDRELSERRKADAAKQAALCSLFEGTKFFLNREILREMFTFIIRSFGGQVSWHSSVCIGATYPETDETITHQLVDRPNPPQTFINRCYVQPQWVCDCVNAGVLLPVQDYFPGVLLPPHLSPFVEEKEGDYIPPEKLKLLALQRGDTGAEDDEEEEEVDDDGGDDDDEDDEEVDAVEKKQEKSLKKAERKRIEKKEDVRVTDGRLRVTDEVRVGAEQEAEEKRLALMMMKKRDKHLYDKIMKTRKRKRKEANKLVAKRKAIDASAKVAKKQKTKQR